MIRNKFSGLLGEKMLKISTVSRATGISRTTLTNLYFKRGRGIEFETLNKLCEYLECNVDDLFEYVEDVESGGKFYENHEAEEKARQLLLH